MTDNLLALRRQEADRPLIATHRGTSAGLVYPNTAAAGQVAVASGSDIVELDTVRTMDGQYLTFHDGYEPFLLGDAANLGTLSLEEAGRRRYGTVNGHGGVSAVEGYADVLAALPGTFINVDRSFRYWGEGFLSKLATWADPRYMLVKSTVAPEYLQALSECDTAFPYIPIVSTVEEIETVLGWEELNVVGLEVLARSHETRLADPAYIAELKERGQMIWLNAINLEDGRDLYCGWDDLVSVLGNPDKGWGRLVAQGADIIQTDFPWLLKPYLESLRQ